MRVNRVLEEPSLVPHGSDGPSVHRLPFMDLDDVISCFTADNSGGLADENVERFLELYEVRIVFLELPDLCLKRSCFFIPNDENKAHDAITHLLILGRTWTACSHTQAGLSREELEEALAAARYRAESQGKSLMLRCLFDVYTLKVPAG